MAAELAEAEREYPAAWIDSAFKEAALQNVRRWRYVSRILERYAREGLGGKPAASGPAPADPTWFADRYARGKTANA